MISAGESNSGKTVITTGILEALRQRGKSLSAVKCGPDYIDPMFHETVQGISCRNIDIFLMGRNVSRKVVERCSENDFLIAEGAMGFYDGIAGRDEYSAHDIAVLTDMPVLLVICPASEGNTLAAKISGLQNYRKDDRIRGIILNKCSKRQFEYFKKIIERENGIPVIGYVEKCRAAEFESRHLGLKDPSKLPEIRKKIEELAAEICKNLDIDALIALMKEDERPEGRSVADKGKKQVKCRIAYARDEAFSFYYRNSLEKLEEEGAELVPFSPIRDKALPEAIDALYLGGGYPELYAGELGRNEPVKAAIRAAVKKGMPLIAECGGFLYLGESLTGMDGREYEMAGVFKGRADRCERPVRFGYCTMKAQTNSMLFNKGEEIGAHEFHYWDSTEIGRDMIISKEGREDKYNECFVSESMYAGFPHICLDTKLPLAKRFVNAAQKYKEGADR